MILKNKIVCTAVALLTATAMLVPNVGFAKKAKKKPALNFKKITLKVGKSKTLKVKNTKKKVKWYSSKKKIATVSKKGVVKAKKAGKTTITAKVGKVKLKCSVKVTAVSKNNSSTNTNKQPIVNQIMGVKVLNDSTISVELSQTQQLTQSAFTVMTKQKSAGIYNKKMTLDSISTSDGKSYKLTVGEEETIEKGYSIKVSIAGLTGSKGEVSKEAIYDGKDIVSKDSTVIKAVVGDKIAETVFISSGQGYLKLNKVETPSGISYKAYINIDDDDGIEFSGSPTKAGVFDCNVEYQDELGKKYVYVVHWVIGSTDKISAYVEDVQFSYSKSMEYPSYTSKYISIVGGSGQYTTEMVDTSNGSVAIDEDYYSDDTNNKTRLNISNMSEGNKTYTVKISDVQNPSLTYVLTGKIIVRNAINVSGFVSDAAGTKLTSDEVEVTFYLKDESLLQDGVDDSCYTYLDSEKNGEYTTDEIIPGTYDVRVSYCGEETKVARNIEIKNSCRLDFKVKDKYLVKLSSDGNETVASVMDNSTVEWENKENGGRLGFKDELLLPNGTYSVTSEVVDGMRRIVLGASFVVAGKSTTAPIKLEKEDNMIKGSIQEDEELDVQIEYYGHEGIYSYYKFVPSETADYAFYTESRLDTVGNLVLKQDSYYEQLDRNDDGGDNSNFYISCECEAGKEYYIGVRGYSDYEFGKNVKLIVEKDSLDDDDDDDDEEDDE